MNNHPKNSKTVGTDDDIETPVGSKRKSSNNDGSKVPKKQKDTTVQSSLKSYFTATKKKPGTVASSATAVTPKPVRSTTVPGQGQGRPNLVTPPNTANAGSFPSNKTVIDDDGDDDDDRKLPAVNLNEEVEVVENANLPKPSTATFFPRDKMNFVPRKGKEQSSKPPIPIHLPVRVNIVDGVHYIETNVDTKKETALFRIAVSDTVERAVEVSSKELFPILMDYNVLRCPDHLSPTAPFVIKPTWDITNPVVYAKSTDESLKDMLKIGMAMRIGVRYPTKTERDCLSQIFCLGWVPVDLDKIILRHQRDLLTGLIDNPETVFELRAWLTMFYERKAADLGLRKNLYMQQVECANQTFFGLDMPCEALACDIEGIRARRQLVLDSINAVLPHLLSELVAVDGTPLVVTNANFHCTSSWKTGADDDLLSSNIVATDYASDRAPWDNALHKAVYPNGDETGKRTAKTIFSKDYSQNQLADGEVVIEGSVDKGASTFCVEYLDQNKTTVFKKRPKELDNILKRKGFVLRFVILNEIRIWVHPTTKSLMVVHPPLSFAMDSRGDIPMEKSARRFIIIEILHLLAIGLKQRKDRFTMEDIPRDKDAIFASFVYESTINHFHQDKRAACAIARDVLTDDSINACVQNELEKIPEEQGVSLQSHRRYRDQTIGSKSRTIVYYKTEYARNRTTWHGFDKKHAKLSMGKVNPDATISELTGDLDGILEGDNGIDINSKSFNWRNFLKNSILPGPLREDLTQTRNSEHRANRGNTLPHAQRNLQVNKQVAEDLCASGEYFWLRGGTVPLEVLPGSNKLQPRPHTLPNFGDIDTEPNLPKNPPVYEQSVSRFVPEYLTGGLEGHNDYKLTKLRKAFATEEGEVVHKGGPKKLSPKEYRGKDKPDYPSWLIYFLCQLEKR